METKRKASTEQDLELISIIKTGEKKVAEKAFAELFTKYRRLILNRYKSKVGNEMEAEDLAMEVMEKCHSNIGRYNSDSGAFSTWVFSVTRNHFIDKLRKDKETFSIQEMGTTDDEGNVREKDFSSGDLNAEQLLVAEERSENLSQLIAKVLNDKPHLQEMLEMRYFDELSYEEIAEATDRPIGTVKAHLFRAKELLRDAVKKNNITF